MYQIGIISQPSRSLILIQSVLHQAKGFETSTFTQPWRAAHALQKHRFDALVFHSEKTGVNLDVLNRRIRKIYPQNPIAYIVTHDKGQELRLPKDDASAVVIDYETETYDAPGIIEKLMSGASVFNRSTRRFATAQNAVVVSGAEDRSGARLINLGLRGAQLRVFGRDLRKGDKVQLQVSLGSLNRQRMVSARVIWTLQDNQAGSNSTPLRVGLEFTLPKAV
jgi:hypothetical protein